MQSLKWSLIQYDQYPLDIRTHTHESVFKRHWGEMVIQKPTRKKKKKQKKKKTRERDINLAGNDFILLDSRVVRKQMCNFLNNPVCDILLKQHEQTNTIIFKYLFKCF